MTPEEIKEKVLQYKWEFWFNRPWGPFMLSIFKDGMTRESIRKAGVDAEWPAIVFQNGAWYRSDEVWGIFAKELEAYLQSGGTVFEVVRSCEKYGRESLKKVRDLAASTDNPIKKLEELRRILTLDVSFIWLTHGFEYLYVKELHTEVPKYMQGDVEKNIGDISYPEKKNEHVYFEQALRSDMALTEVQEKFAWIKVRDGFSEGFSIEELSEERKRLRNSPEKEEYKRPEVPQPLRELVAIAQELVYFRTLRTDIFGELIYRSRPILKEVAEKYSLAFEGLREYSIHDLISGNLERYEYDNFSSISFGKEFALLHGPVLSEDIIEKVTEIKGVVAFKGKVTGKVKVVMNAHQIDKVEKGDVLVAPTTAPSYVIGMQKAAAFVTDEGGITSHAAIVSREMRKPCVIGTKMATRVLHDGDMVEVDAEKGVVRILENKT